MFVNPVYPSLNPHPRHSSHFPLSTCVETTFVRTHPLPKWLTMSYQAPVLSNITEVDAQHRIRDDIHSARLATDFHHLIQLQAKRDCTTPGSEEWRSPLIFKRMPQGFLRSFGQREALLKWLSTTAQSDHADRTKTCTLQGGRHRGAAECLDDPEQILIRSQIKQLGQRLGHFETSPGVQITLMAGLTQLRPKELLTAWSSLETDVRSGMKSLNDPDRTTVTHLPYSPASNEYERRHSMSHRTIRVRFEWDLPASSVVELDHRPQHDHTRQRNPPSFWSLPQEPLRRRRKGLQRCALFRAWTVT